MNDGMTATRRALNCEDIAVYQIPVARSMVRSTRWPHSRPPRHPPPLSDARRTCCLLSRHRPTVVRATSWLKLRRPARSVTSTLLSLHCTLVSYRLHSSLFIPVSTCMYRVGYQSCPPQGLLLPARCG
ncbi:hypothetical protein J6590_066398 [Homalodisca vitripennis]|nr:hypothetical protein J6590_066398 [Homalodisca vitripennis]